MDGFTVKNSGRFLQNADIGEFKSLPIESPKGSGDSFAQTLTKAVGEVNELQKASDKGMQNLAAGKTDNIPDVMIAAERAEIALKLMVQVRNKIIDAYQEVMKMQV